MRKLLLSLMVVGLFTGVSFAADESFVTWLTSGTADNAAKICSQSCEIKYIIISSTGSSNGPVYFEAGASTQAIISLGSTMTGPITIDLTKAPLKFKSDATVYCGSGSQTDTTVRITVVFEKSPGK